LACEDGGRKCRIQKKITSAYRSKKSPFNSVESGQYQIGPRTSGLLSGKYSREDFLNKSGSTGFQGSRKNGIETLGKFTQRNMQIVDEVKKVASELKKSPAQVALAWLLSKSTVTSVLLGASKLEQLENNLCSLNTHLSPDQIKRLDDISRVEMGSRMQFSRTQRSNRQSLAELKSIVGIPNINGLQKQTKTIFKS
jgi:hypothetical protein